MVRETMTASRIALLWIVLVASWYVLNLNDPLEKVSRFVFILAEWRSPSYRYPRYFPAREVAWFSFAVFTIGMTWRHNR